MIKYNDADFYTHYESIKLLENSITDNGTYHLMKSKDTDYICHIPQFTPAQSDQPTIDDQNRQQKIQEAYQKIKGSLSGKCLFQRSGYWSYAFCLDQELSQFNGNFQQFLEKKVSKFILGKIKKSDSHDRYTLNKEGDLWYLRYNLEGGTVCDLTGRSRSAEIQFICDPGQDTAALKWVKEYKSCQYQAQVSVPELCADDLLGRDKEEKIHEVECKKVVNTDIDVVDKQDYIKSSFNNHPDKITLADYNLVTSWSGIFIAIPKSKEGTTIFIYNTDELDDNFFNNIAKTFFTALSRDKVPLQSKAAHVLGTNGEFSYDSYVYGRSGRYLTTVEIKKRNNGEVVLYDRSELSHLETNFRDIRTAEEISAANEKLKEQLESQKKEETEASIEIETHIEQAQPSEVIKVESQEKPTEVTPLVEEHGEQHVLREPQEQQPQEITHDEL